MRSSLFCKESKNVSWVMKESEDEYLLMSELPSSS